MNRAHSPCIPIPDKSPCFAFYANGEKPVEQHWEFNTVESFLKVKKTCTVEPSLMYLAMTSWVAKIASVQPVCFRKADWLRCGKPASVRVGSSLDKIGISKILENIEFIVIPW